LNFILFASSISPIPGRPPFFPPGAHPTYTPARKIPKFHFQPPLDQRSAINRFVTEEVSPRVFFDRSFPPCCVPPIRPLMEAAFKTPPPSPPVFQLQQLYFENIVLQKSSAETPFPSRHHTTPLDRNTIFVHDPSEPFPNTYPSTTYPPSFHFPNWTSS